MNKSILLALLCTIICAQQGLRAQIPSSVNRSALGTWRAYQSLLPETQSAKTTNTKKRVKAFSYRNVGSNFIDSFLILIPGSKGYSILDYQYFYPEYMEGVDNTYYYLDDIIKSGHVDYLKALYYRNDNLLTHADTLYKTLSPTGKLLSFEDKTYNTANSQYYLLEKSYRQYDNLDRLIKREHESMAGPGLTKYDYQYYYSPLNDYIKISFDYKHDTTLLYFRDSIVYNAGKIMSSYSIDTNGNLALGYNLYYYNSNQELIKSERYEGLNLSEVFEIFRRPNSDFPDSFYYTYYPGGAIHVELGYYSYNASTGYLESFTLRHAYSGDTLDRITYISTDVDGDITAAKLFDVFFMDTLSITKLYYFDDLPSSINSSPTFDSDVQVYPVPSSQEVKITSSELFNGFALYDVSGRVLQARTFTKTRESIVDLSAYSPGIYFLEVKNDNQVKLIKVQKD